MPERTTTILWRWPWKNFSANSIASSALNCCKSSTKRCVPPAPTESNLQEALMARISGAPVRQGGPFRRLFVWIIYSLTRRRLGRGVMPVQATAQHPKIFWGYVQMEQSQSSSNLVDARLKGLAELRVATLVGCPF